ncbi:MAG: hypothetical protein K9L86_05000 [Candidatus Omnitrophica bacterium]|nr:hypothetical protein [Candidatus Omnitrophota bacterium]
MISGTKTVNKSLSETIEKLKTMLASANCEITEQNKNTIKFKHGTFFTQTSFMFPKVGVLKLEADLNKTKINYEIEINKFLKIWITLFAIIGCIFIFPPIAAYFVLVKHPRKFIENILYGV